MSVGRIDDSDESRYEELRAGTVEVLGKLGGRSCTFIFDYFVTDEQIAAFFSEPRTISYYTVPRTITVKISVQAG